MKDYCKDMQSSNWRGLGWIPQPSKPTISNQTDKIRWHGGAKYVILYGHLNRMIILNFNTSLNPQKYWYITECMKYFIGIYTTYNAINAV